MGAGDVRRPGNPRRYHAPPNADDHRRESIGTKLRRLRQRSERRARPQQPDPDCDDKIAETATLRNVGAETYDLDGWKLCSIRGAQTHAPLSGALAPGEERVFPNAGGTVWSNGDRDDGALYDPQGRLVSYWFDPQ